MTFWSELRNAVRRAILVEDRLERLSADVERSGDQLRDHERRLTRIETMIEIARANRAIPPTADRG
jgi:hypothetical protein